MSFVSLISILAVAFVFSACSDDDSSAAVDQSALESVIAETAVIPGSQPEDLDVACELSDGDGIEDRWDCTVEADAPATRAEERRLRIDLPDDRGVRVLMAAWVAEPASEEFPPGSVAAVQVGGDGLFEGGGATTAGGCCVELESP